MQQAWPQQADGKRPGGMTRRAFLCATGKAGMALAATAGVGFLGGRAPALAQTRTLHVLEWSSFVKEADVIRDQQAAEFGIVAGGQKLAGLLLTLAEVHGLGLQAAQGLVLTEGYYWDLNDKTRDLGQRFFKRTGRMPNILK